MYLILQLSDFMIENEYFLPSKQVFLSLYKSIYSSFDWFSLYLCILN